MSASDGPRLLPPLTLVFDTTVCDGCKARCRIGIWVFGRASFAGGRSPPETPPVGLSPAVLTPLLETLVPILLSCP